ncbi:MAG: adenosylcobinamide-phosphate synthase CbiB [Methylibium sp.]|nr:adenosylcobinamide-phosphate synthase CbiB [Methylibium sp.]
MDADASVPVSIASLFAAPAAPCLALALPLAWAFDAVFGEPRNAWHPVAWMGRALAPVGRWLVARPPVPAFAAGASVWLLLAAGLGLAGAALQSGLSATPSWLAVPLLALALKPMFAWRMLRDEVAAVERSLALGIDAGRAQMARLVSRDTRHFDADTVRESAIETLAENLNDSVVAPLFWFALFGLPGAVIYRLANTLDAMWGYRGRWEWAGKWAARADDLLSWLPARLTALLLCPVSSWPALRMEAARTPSPNGGWPMAAMALRLGVRLRKPDVYALNERAPSPDADRLAQGLRHATVAAWVAMALATLSWAGRS